MDGFLSVEAQAALMAHREQCAECAQYDVRIRRSLLALQAIQPITPSAGFHERLARRIAQEATTPTPAPRRVHRALIGGMIAASIAVLFASGMSWQPSTAIRLMPVVARAPEPLPQVPATSTAIATAHAKPAHTPRFEALSEAGFTGMVPMRARVPAVRMQLATYPGQ